MMKINKLICLVLLLLMFLITGCNKSNNQNEEEGFKLPTEDSVSQKLGGNYAFTLEFNGAISFTTKYIVTENGYYVEYLSDDGMPQSLYDKFQAIHCFNRLSKVQIKDIIMSDPNSALNNYKDVCNSLGIELVIEDDFLDTLINRA